MCKPVRWEGAEAAIGVSEPCPGVELVKEVAARRHEAAPVRALLVLGEARAAARGERPRPLCITQQWRFAFVAVCVSSTAFPVVDFLTPVPSGCLFTANSSPSTMSVLQTPCSSTQPLCAPADTSQAGGVQGCGMNHLCKSHSVLPATEVCCSLLQALEAPLLSQLTSPLLRGLPRVWEPLLIFSSPQGRRSRPTFSPLPFPFFFLSSYLVMWGSFLSF